MRAPGHLQAMFACESQADLVARRLGMDPTEFRRMNLMHDGDAAPLGEVVPHVKATETLAKALDESGYKRAKPKHIGRGCAIADWVSKGGESYALLQIDDRWRGHARLGRDRYRPRGFYDDATDRRRRA